MSKGKWKNPRTDKKVQVGGKMNPELAEWVKQNGGFPTVEKAVELYKKMIEDKTMNATNKQLLISAKHAEFRNLIGMMNGDAYVERINTAAYQQYFAIYSKTTGEQIANTGYFENWDDAKKHADIFNYGRYSVKQVEKPVNNIPKDWVNFGMPENFFSVIDDLTGEIVDIFAEVITKCWTEYHASESQSVFDSKREAEIYARAMEIYTRGLHNKIQHEHAMRELANPEHYYRNAA